MPTKTAKDAKGCYAQWGGSGEKYYYACSDDDAEKRAIEKANSQGAAAHAGGYQASSPYEPMELTAQQFADATGVSTKKAKKILDILEAKKLEPADLNGVLWRLRDMVIARDLGKLMEKLSDEEVEGVIDQMVIERSMYQCPKQVCYARNFEQLQSAFSNLGKPESVWFFSQIEEKKDGGYKKGDVVTIQIFRVGKWEHPDYGTVEITKSTIQDVVEHFKDRKRGIELCVDENHEPDHKALGWYKEVYDEEDGKKCFAKIELTKKGADLLNDGAYKYFSPEICFSKVDEESGELMQNLLIGGAFTNRPFFKGMQPLLATEGAAADGRRAATAANSPYFFSNNTMHKLLLLMDKILADAKFTSAEKSELEVRYNEIPKEKRTAELNEKIAELLAKFEDGEDGGKPADGADGAAAGTDGAAAGGDGGEGGGAAAGGDGAEGAEGAKPEGTDGEVKANEDGTFTVDGTFMESVKGMQTQLNKVTRDATIRACESQVRGLCFSDAKPTNVVLPKHVTKISQFAASLSAPQRKVFFEIMGSLKAVPAGEKGHGKDSPKMDFSDPTTIHASDEKVQYFMEKLHQDLPTAQKSAAHHYAEQAKRK